MVSIGPQGAMPETAQVALTENQRGGNNHEQNNQDRGEEDDPDDRDQEGVEGLQDCPTEGSREGAPRAGRPAWYDALHHRYACGTVGHEPPYPRIREGQARLRRPPRGELASRQGHQIPGEGRRNRRRWLRDGHGLPRGLLARARDVT